MRLRLRILGADVLELLTGSDARDELPEIEQGPGALSADLTTAPRPYFGFAGDDEPRTYPEERA